MKLVIVSAAIVLALTGCATAKWTHNSKGQQDYYRDNSQCMAMANSGGSNQIYSNPYQQGQMSFNNGFSSGYNQGAAMATAANRNQMYNECMYGNGWYIVRE